METSLTLPKVKESLVPSSTALSSESNVTSTSDEELVYVSAIYLLDEQPDRTSRTGDVTVLPSYNTILSQFVSEQMSSV